MSNHYLMYKWCYWITLRMVWLRSYLFQIIQLRTFANNWDLSQDVFCSGRSSYSSSKCSSGRTNIIFMIMWTRDHFSRVFMRAPLSPYDQVTHFFNHVMIVWFFNKKIQVELLPDKKRIRTRIFNPKCPIEQILIIFIPRCIA